VCERTYDGGEAPGRGRARHASRPAPHGQHFASHEQTFALPIFETRDSLHRQPLRVLILDRTVGSSPQAIGLAEGLRANGAQVRIGGPASATAQGLVPVYPRSGVQGQRAAKLVDLIIGAGRFLATLISFRPHIIHLQWPGPLDLGYARFASLLVGSRVVFTSHVPTEREAGELGREAMWLRRALRTARAVITLGPSLTEGLRSAYPGLNGKVHTITHGNFEHVIERHPRDEARRRLGLPEGEPLFAFLGQIRRRKGLETLLDAHKRYRAGGGAGRLLIAGAATEPAYFDEVRQRDPGDGAITWLTSSAALPQETLDLAASAANQIVLPFHSASQSGIAIFSLTHGRCVVTTRVGEVGRTVEGHGILVEPGDAAALAEAMTLVDRDPEECDRIGAAAREYALEDLSWTPVGQRVGQIYAEALA
jgi:glycosyltransferase involved in cell wall biosynthesis